MAQKPNNSAFRQFYEEISKYYQTDQQLVNGYISYPPDSRIEGNPYFRWNAWKPATLYIQGKEYSNQLIRFDLVNNEIILKARMVNDNIKLIEINKYQLDSFRVEGHFFVNSRKFGLRKEQVYLEQIFHGEFSYVRRHIKRFVDKRDIVTPHGKYSARKIRNYIISNEKMLPVNRRKAFLDFFSKEQRKKIRKFIRNNHIQYKKVDNQELKTLLNYCQDVIHD
jgi:hypothetical protein